jgi:phage tail protein X
MDFYKNIEIIKNDTGKRYYRNIKFPEIPLDNNDIYVIITEGDRYDLLSNQYYNDSSLWKIILLANPSLPQDTLFPPIGVQIRIPSDPYSFIISFNKINNE